jgi:hypothetical protein
LRTDAGDRITPFGRQEPARRKEIAVMKSVLSLVGVTFLLGIATPPAVQATQPFSSSLEGNVANQVIAGFPSSVVTWTIDRGNVSLLRLGNGDARIFIRTEGLIIPDLGFNPSPDLLAHIVCHDSAGVASEGARTQTVSFPESGDARLIDTVSLPEECFAPIALLTGSVDPQGESPGKFFAVSAF